MPQPHGKRMPKPKIDKDVIRELADLLEQTGLTEIEWSEAGVQVRVARTLAVQHAIAPAAGHAGSHGAAAPAAVQAQAMLEANAVADLTHHPGAVKSPMVGTVYVAPEPGAPSFVKEGDAVTEGQTVIIVEAMKTMNPIQAHRAGKIKQILVENQMPVEYGQVLLVIE